MTTVAGSSRAVVTMPSDTQIMITRQFAAPRALVFKAWTTPDLVRRWWSANRGEMTVAEIDLRVGGSWRYAMIAHNEFEVAFHGEYREIVPDERIVSTEVYEGAPDAEAVTTATFAEEAGHTTVTILVEYPRRSDRDRHLQSGMEDGLQDALSLLEQVVGTLR